MKRRTWRFEIARDVLALGSWIFYALVLARALIGPFWLFFWQLAIAGIAVIILISASGFRKGLEFDSYVSRGLILLVLTIIFYQNSAFSLFAAFIYVLLLASSWLLGKSWKEIALGFATGAVASGIGYWLAPIASRAF
jgi:hypothetical protein